MSFRKSLVALGMALVAVAAAAPAAMATTFENEGGPLENGTEVSALGTNVVITTAAGTIKCNEFEVSGDVQNNGAEEAELEITNIRAEGGGAKGFCGVSSSPSLGIKLTKIWGGIIIFFPDTTDFGFLEFTYDIEPLGIECHFEGFVETTWEYAGPLDTILPSGLTGSGAPGCPSAGSIEGEMEFQNGVTITS
jgi:hypothetical protein